MFHITSKLLKASVLALCVVTCFVLLFLFSLYDDDAERRVVTTNLDFEQRLCKDTIKRTNISRSSRCPQKGIVTVKEGGRLGNQMWEYASVWAVARRTGLEPYIPRCMRIKLDQIFDQLSVPAFDKIAHCPVEINTFVTSLKSWTYTNQSIILRKYSMQLDLVLTWAKGIIKEFKLRKELRVQSQQVLRNFLTLNSIVHHHTFVGVHIRRTDYIGYLSRKYRVSSPANTLFYLNAMQYFEKKYPNVVFIVVSDDPKWCLKKFSQKNNVFVASAKHNSTPELDLATMAACNHTIIDYGTFGEWGALLAGGETIYYNNNLKHHTAQIGKILKNWHSL